MNPPGKGYTFKAILWGTHYVALGKPEALVKVPVCPLAGVYARNVPAPDLPCEHSTPLLTLPGLPMPQLPEGAFSLGKHVLKPGGAQQPFNFPGR